MRLLRPPRRVRSGKKKGGARRAPEARLPPAPAHDTHDPRHSGQKNGVAAREFFGRESRFAPDRTRDSQSASTKEPRADDRLDHRQWSGEKRATAIRRIAQGNPRRKGTKTPGIEAARRIPARPARRIETARRRSKRLAAISRPAPGMPMRTPPKPTTREHSSKDPPLRATSVANEAGPSDGMESLDTVCGGPHERLASRLHQCLEPRRTSGARDTPGCSHPM